MGHRPAAEVRTILAENPARVFGFDLAALAPHAERVGPLVGELEAYQPTRRLWRW